MKHLIAPSILAADFGNLKRDIEMLNSSEADWIHVDIMDGIFVPNISFGFPVLQAIKQYSTKPLDVHLMIVKPDRYISRFKDAGANNLIVHFEACTHLRSTIANIKQEDMLVGVAINPHTSVTKLNPIIENIDQVIIMSVNPGFGGQKFITNTYKKIEAVRNLLDKSGSKARIEVDGGVNLMNAAKMIDLGATILVAGSSIFKSENPKKSIVKFKSF